MHRPFGVLDTPGRRVTCDATRVAGPGRRACAAQVGKDVSELASLRLDQFSDAVGAGIAGGPTASASASTAPGSSHFRRDASTTKSLRLGTMPYVARLPRTHKTAHTYHCVSAYGGTPPHRLTAPLPALYAAKASGVFRNSS